MANIPFRVESDFERLFQMGSGFIMDFSNSSFERFVNEVANIAIYTGIGYTDYCSKANKLRQIINTESDSIVGNLLHELLLYCKSYLQSSGTLSTSDEKKIEELLVYTSQMMTKSLSVELPKSQEETLKTLLDDINSALSR